ncbi:unnamed protein product [Rotaria sordida]|uniref:Reverse transcriptase domain-containing protein n=1 Tax=Rotaria sordida TaxID=392033 RepID=A0A815IXI7_9BILA|nr:unnamed protein product [Rotaria sordida]
MPPKRSWWKEYIIQWLNAHNINVPVKAVKAELLEIAMKNLPEKRYEIDEAAKTYNVDILRLPIKHCMLNPVELAWAGLKQERDDTMKKLKKCMSEITDLAKIPLTLPLYKSYSDRLRSCLTQSYMTIIPLIDQIRALRELKMVQSIRKKLKKHKLMLRATDKSGVLHIGRQIDYERKAAEYRQTTGAYEELTSNPFNDIICQVTRLLNQLQSMKKITEWQRLKLMPIRKKTELAYMYFIPKPHKKGTPLRPILNTIHAATKQISQFLDKSIRPLFDRFVRQTMFVDGADLLDRLQKYIQKGYFNASTLFITFDITNLYTMLPQEESLAILAEFLRVHNCERVNGLSIDNIVELAANIFMWKWDRQTILPKLGSHEIYGRYIDDVFFTCNQSEDKVKELLEAVNNLHPNIKSEYKIGKSVPFLDVLVKNNNGILASSVYHKPSAQPTVVSFLSDHPRHVFQNVIHTALTRAVRYSSSFEVFNNERRAIPNAFVCGNKFYRQIIGGAMGSAFTLTLANIFMWKWERQTILPKLDSHEIYGRYIDDVFFTCNQSEDKVKELLEAANNFHPNIKLEYKIEQQWYSGIIGHHKPSAQPTVVSFLSDHPRHVFQNVIHTALTRAVRYSSSFEVFNNERRAIRLIYPSNYINQQFQKFFADYMSSSSSPFIPMITNPSQFFALRQKLSTQPTAKQTQLATSAAAVHLIQNTQNVTQRNTNNMEATVKRNNNKFKNNLFVHVTHEARLKGLAREIHMIHDSFFKDTSYADIRLVVGHRIDPNIEFELSRKRPSLSLLKDPLEKNQNEIKPLTTATKTNEHC